MPSYIIIQNHHRYTFQEADYGGLKRGITVNVRPDCRKNRATFARNNTVKYRLNDDSNPHDLDINWYIDHFTAFYTALGTAIANNLEANNDLNDWRNHINWPNSITARIHRKDYSATKEN